MSDAGPVVESLHNNVAKESNAETNDDMALALLEMTREARTLQDQTETLKVLRPLAIALRHLFSPFCEVVIHDFADFAHSIVCIEGNVTNRQVGGAALGLLLVKARQGATDEDLYNYMTSLPGGRLMKSCAVFLRDGDGRAFGAFCVNFELSAFLTMQSVMANFVDTDGQGDVVETSAKDIEDTIHSVVADCLHETGQRLPLSSREEKVDLIGRLADRGVFQVKKSVSILAEQLGLSRATIYNYLREVRAAHAATQVTGKSPPSMSL